MARYVFLEDGRRVDLEGGRVTLFPDGGLNFREAIELGEIERAPGGWNVRRDGRELGFARSRRAAVARLMEDAAEELAPRELEWRKRREEQSAELAGYVRELLGLDTERDAAEMAQMAALGVAVAAWRNTHLEDLHAGSHPTGGFPDTDMMRYNVATSRAIAQHVTPAGTDWSALRALLADPDRRLPGGITIRELAGDELRELLLDAANALRGMRYMERAEGRSCLYARLALQAAMYARDWYGTPWWPDVVDAFLDLLADRSSAAWEHDDGSRPEPASVADREALRSLLLERPEALDDDGIWWCHSHGLAFEAPGRGFARWRKRREPDWQDPNAWRHGDR